MRSDLFTTPKLFLFTIITTLFISNTKAQTVTPWITSGDKSKLLQQQPTVSFGNNIGTNPNTITLNTAQTFQSMEGFGWTFTEGSAEVISGLNSTEQNTLLNELFNPTTGLSSAVMRISIGASDLSSSDYTYNETVGDINMTNFSLAGPDQTYLFPLIKKVLLINPNIKILATPWTAPTWMKENKSFLGSTVNGKSGAYLTQYNAAYAKYFVKYLQAMKAIGIDIWGITPQNEPTNAGNDPGMTMTSTDQKNFINQELGPQMATAGFGSVKIIGYDHNCDNTAFPIDVATSNYVDGSAFHLYGGKISAMTTVHDATNKNVYFTEQYTDSNGTFDGDLGYHMQNIVIGSTNNWAKTVFEWNLAVDTNVGPHTSGVGTCAVCLGAITINSSTSYTRNVAYYIIGQISKFVKTGAVRIGTTIAGTNITTVGFKNPDGSIALLAYNANTSATTVKIVNGSNAFDYSIPPSSAVTFNWSTGPAVAVTGVSVTPTTGTVSVNNSLQLTETVVPATATNKNVTWKSSNPAIASVNGTGLVSGVAVGSAIITVTTQDGNNTATSNLTVNVVSVTGVNVNPTTAALFPGETQQLTASVLPAGASNTGVTWASSDMQVATVNTTGLVSAVTSGTATITATTIDGSKTATSSFTIKNQEPYGGTSATIPGVIQIENYDLGGQNVAYNDTDTSNNGNQYRKTEGVDIDVIAGTTGYTTGWTVDGEWLEYTTNVTAGKYTIVATVASPRSGKQLVIKLDDVTLTTVAVPNTGDYGVFQDVTIPDITFAGGNNKVLRLEIVGGDFNMDKITIQGTLGINENEYSSGLTIYPNPAINYLKINSSHIGDGNINIYAVTGQLVLQSKFKTETTNTNKTIDISSLQKGIYIIKVTDEKGTYFRKMMKH
jgi:O-glycosyl hydrolase